MTPDELRRLDTNDCIILIQALRPVKAKKYWYFKIHPLYKEAKSCEISHLSLSEVKRGNYVVTNPYDLINSQGDLFDNDEITIDNTVQAPKDEKVDEQNEFDIQVELEKKFDELFGKNKIGE